MYSGDTKRRSARFFCFASVLRARLSFFIHSHTRALRRRIPQFWMHCDAFVSILEAFRWACINFGGIPMDLQRFVWWTWTDANRMDILDAFRWICINFGYSNLARPKITPRYTKICKMGNIHAGILQFGVGHISSISHPSPNAAAVRFGRRWRKFTYSCMNIAHLGVGSRSDLRRNVMASYL